MDLVGCVDLRHLAVRDGSVPGKLGLQSLAQNYLNVHLNKVSQTLYKNLKDYIKTGKVK